MSTNEDVAYRSNDPEVVAAWDAFKDATDRNNEARRAIETEVGRRLMVRRRGFGHGTEASGFERLDTDRDGELIGEGGALIVKKSDRRMVAPNRRRKAGKVLDERLGNLDSPGVKLPGMPEMHFAGFAMLAPALWQHEGHVYALWSDEVSGVGEQWEPIPLSTYYAAKEAHDA